MSFTRSGSFSWMVIAAVVCLENPHTVPFSISDSFNDRRTRSVMSTNSGMLWLSTSSVAM